MGNDYRVLQSRLGPRPESSETHLASEVHAELRSELRTAPRTAHRLGNRTAPRYGNTYGKLVTEPRGETPTANRHVLRHAYRLENPQRLPTPDPRFVSVLGGVRFEGPLRYSTRLPERARLHASESDTFAGTVADTEAGCGSRGGDVERPA